MENNYSQGFVIIILNFLIRNSYITYHMNWVEHWYIIEREGEKEREGGRDGERERGDGGISECVKEGVRAEGCKEREGGMQRKGGMKGGGERRREGGSDEGKEGYGIVYVENVFLSFLLKWDAMNKYFL